MVLAVPDETKPDPIAAMLTVDDEQMRGRELPEAELNTDPPADKPVPERDETGKFKGKEEKEEKPKDEPKVEKEEKRNDHVPLAKYLEEKNKLRDELAQRDITLKQFQEELAALKAKLPKEDAPKEPDFVEDPKGYVDHKLSQTMSAIEEHNKKAEAEGKKAQETAAQASQQVQVQRFLTDLGAQEARFVQSNPDYQDALNHLRTVRAAQLREFDPEITQDKVIGIIRQEEIQLAIQLAQQGRDPIQTAYNLARHYGYAKKEAKPEVKLPETTERRLPPDQTLGSGSTESVREEAENPDNPIDQALASLFKKRA